MNKKFGQKKHRQSTDTRATRGLLTISTRRLVGRIDVREGEVKCSYGRADSIRDRRPTADCRMGIHPQLANVDLAVYGDLAFASVE